MNDKPCCFYCVSGFEKCGLGKVIISKYLDGFEFNFTCSMFGQYVPEIDELGIAKREKN